jgi:hypothetical protein
MLGVGAGQVVKAPTVGIQGVLGAASPPAPSSPPVYRSSTSVNGATAGLPTGTVDGDLMVAGVIATTPATIITPPAGWTSIRQTSIPGVGGVMGTFYKVASGEAPDDIYSWTTGDGDDPIIVIIARYSGVNSGTPTNTDAATTYLGLLSPTATAPDVTTTVGNCLILGWYLIIVDTSVSSVGQGQTSRVAQDGGGNVRTLALADVAQVSAGATGTRTCTFAASAIRNVTQTVALRPA